MHWSGVAGVMIRPFVMWTTRPRFVDDDLRALMGLLLPPWPERSPDPRPVDDRRCLQGVLRVLFNGIAWQLLSLELELGSRQAWWRRLDRWQKAGVFGQLHRILLAALSAASELGWSRACVDGSLVRAKRKGGRHRPVAGRPAETGSKRHLICGGRGNRSRSSPP